MELDTVRGDAKRMSPSIIEQLRMIRNDHRRELTELKRKRAELSERLSGLDAEEIEVTRGIMKAEQALESYGYWE